MMALQMALAGDEDDDGRNGSCGGTDAAAAAATAPMLAGLLMVVVVGMLVSVLFLRHRLSSRHSAIHNNNLKHSKRLCTHSHAHTLSSEIRTHTYTLNHFHMKAHLLA